MVKIQIFFGLIGLNQRINSKLMTAPSIFNQIDTGAAFCHLFDDTAQGIWDQAFYYGAMMGFFMGVCMMNALKG